MRYIRKKRLIAAAQEFTNGYNLYDIAISYGFETQAGFYKAFQNEFNCSPSEYKNHLILHELGQNTPKLTNSRKVIGENIMENLCIRKVRQTDCKEIWENVFSRNTPKEVEERISSSLQKMKIETQIQLVAVVDGIVVGTMVLAKEQHPFSQHIAKLYDVIVNPTFQRMGIAKELFKESQKYAVKYGITIIRVECRGKTSAEEFYKKIGFIEAGRIPNAIIENYGEKRSYDEVMLYTIIS